MTATTVLGQRTKNSLEGRNAKKHGFPIKMAEMLASARWCRLRRARRDQQCPQYLRTRRMLKSALAAQDQKRGFSFVEILTHVPHWLVH